MRKLRATFGVLGLIIGVSQSFAYTLDSTFLNAPSRLESVTTSSGGAISSQVTITEPVQVPEVTAIVAAPVIPVTGGRYSFDSNFALTGLKLDTSIGVGYGLVWADCLRQGNSNNYSVTPWISLYGAVTYGLVSDKSGAVSQSLTLAGFIALFDIVSVGVGYDFLAREPVLQIGTKLSTLDTLQFISSCIKSWPVSWNTRPTK